MRRRIAMALYRLAVVIGGEGAFPSERLVSVIEDARGCRCEGEG